MTLLSVAARLGSWILPPPSVAVDAAASTSPAEAVSAAQTPQEPLAEEMRDMAAIRAGAARSAEFTVFVDRLIARLAAGELGLREASDQVLHYCLAKHPAYLYRVTLIEPNLNFRATLARAVFRLAQHTTRDLHGVEVPEEMLANLEAELAAILLEEGYDDAVRTE